MPLAGTVGQVFGPHALVRHGWPMLFGPHARTGHGGWGPSGPMRSPGTVARGGRAPCTHRARRIRVGSGAMPSPARWPPQATPRTRSLVRPRTGVFDTAGSRSPTIGIPLEPPAALMGRPMVGPTQQHQVGQVGGAAIESVPDMVGLAPPQRPAAAGEHTAAVPHGQGLTLGRGDDPAGSAHIQRLAGGAAQGRGEPGHGRLQPPGQLGRALDPTGIVRGVWSGVGEAQPPGPSWCSARPVGSWWRSAGRPGRMRVRVHGGNLSTPRPNTTAKPNSGDNFSGESWRTRAQQGLAA